MDETPAGTDGDTDERTGAGQPAGAAAHEDSAVRPGPGRSAYTLGRFVALVAVLVLLVDQLTKTWAVAALTDDRAPVTVVTGLLRLRLYRNSGAAFSFATGTTWLFTLVACVVSVVIVRISRRLGSRGWALALGLLLGGALGNLSDRLFRWPGFARGHVVDFLDLQHFFIFNLADASITCAAVLIGWLGLRGIGVDGVVQRG